MPCFLFIFAGAPYIEYFRGNKKLTAALSGITAAVVGVILNLGIWFSINTLFRQTYDLDAYGFSVVLPVWNTIEWPALIITLVAFLIYFGWKLNMLKTIFICMVLGLCYKFFLL